MDDRTDLAFLLTSFATTGAHDEASSAQEEVEVSPALTAQTSYCMEDGDVSPKPGSDFGPAKECMSDDDRFMLADPEDKHLKRMKRNRESAALSRNRKKQYVEELLAKVQALDATVHALQTENAQLRGRASLVPTRAGYEGPSSEILHPSAATDEGGTCPLRSSQPALRSPPADSERGCSPNTRRAPHPARSISPTRAGCLALLKMTTGSGAGGAQQSARSQPCAAGAVSHSRELHVC